MALRTILDHFVEPNELKCLRASQRGEEGEFFRTKLKELELLVRTMPKIYEQDGMGDQAVVQLHYFKGGFDWYITERDTTDEQMQAFGMACMHEDELGYICIAELIANGVELDIYWTPKTLAEVKSERARKIAS